MEENKLNKKKIAIIIAFVFFAFITIVQSVSAETLKMNENNCEYIPEINKDRCIAKYEVCDPSIDSRLIEMRYEYTRELAKAKGELSANLPGLTTQSDVRPGKIDCYDVEITGWKSPLTDLDHVLCYDGNCHTEYALWNGTYTYRIAIWGNISTLSGDTKGLIPIQVTINGSSELFHCLLTINQTNHTIGYVYFNNNTDYICVDSNESSAVTTIIDEGNGVDYGTVNETITGFYTLNGTDVFDHSIYDRHGENQSGMVTDNGKIGNGIYFDGTDDYFDIDNMLSKSSTFSIALWINFSGSNEDAIISKYQNANNYYRYLQTQGGANGGKLYTYSDTGTPAFDCVSTNKYNDSVWHHVVIAYTSTTCKIYVDGSQDSSQNTYGGGSLTPFDYGIRTGERNDGVLDYLGMIDNIKIFNRTLSADEIILDYLAFDSINYGSNETNTTIPTPPAPITLEYETTFCYDSTYLYIREKDVADNGTAVFNEYLEYCENGCDNNTIKYLGYPGCKESGFESALMVIVFAIIMFSLVIWVIKK